MNTVWYLLYFVVFIYIRFCPCPLGLLHSHFTATNHGSKDQRITVTSRWARWRLTLLASRLFAPTVCSGADQRRHQNFASLAFVRGIHRWPVDSPHKGQVMRKVFPYDDLITKTKQIPNKYCLSSWHISNISETRRVSAGRPINHSFAFWFPKGDT